MILPRGTRIIVRRVAAERGKGILSRMAQGGLGPLDEGSTNNLGGDAADNGYYTFKSRNRDEDDEFLDVAPPPPQVTAAVVDESKELEALKAGKLILFVVLIFNLNVFIYS